VLLSACGSSAGTALHGSPSPVPSASADSASPTPTLSTPTPTKSPASSPISSGASFSVLPHKQPAGFVSKITCTGSIGAADPVAVVQLHNSSGGDAVLRDYANPSSPRTACVFRNNQVNQLIDARHVVIYPQMSGVDAYAVVDLSEVRYHWFQLPRPTGFGAGLIAVSPRLNEIAWLSNNDRTGGDRKVHLTTKSGDKVVGNLPIALGRCGSSEASKEGAYTNSASHLYVLDQPLPDNTLLVFQGTKQVLAVRPPSGGWPKGVASQPMIAVWSPTTQTLFYRQNGSVWQWTQAGGKQLYLKGISWYYPTFSPDGRHLAYSVLRSDGLHNTYVVDVAHGGSPKLIGKGPRNLPVFLNSTQIFYRSEGNGICGPSVNQPLVYDVTDGSESSTVIDGVSHIWPATSSQF
jgi:hypothetical protein